METICDEPDPERTQRPERVRANLCLRCIWGGDSGECQWGFPEYARGGWNLVQVPDPHHVVCVNYSPHEDDPATRR